MEVVKSPINYTGNKKSLIPDLKNNFPIKINNFYDVFGGSGVVSLNVLNRCNKVFYNELEINFFNLFKFAMTNKTFTPEMLKQLRSKIIIKDKIYYYKLRDKINALLAIENKTERQECLSKNLLLYLQYFTFKHIVRFNKKDFTNSTCGMLEENELSNDKIIEKFMFKNQPLNKLEFWNKDAFDILENNNFNKDDFIYLDPPYTNTGGGLTYCNGWDEKTDERLFKLLDGLTAKGIKWGLSNVFLHRDLENTHLKLWAEKNNYNILYFEKTYTLAKNQKGITKEVYIFNYESPKPKQQTFKML